MIKLFKHQRYSLDFLSTQDRVLDLSDPGTGKTAVEVLAFERRRRTGGKCALVYAPKTLLTSVWVREVEIFAPELRAVAAYASNREEAFGADADIYITNHDATRWVHAQPKGFHARFDTLILDESTAYKHGSAKRSSSLAKMAPHYGIRRALTGSPTPNGICDVWHQALLVDDGRRLGRSFYAFRSAVCTPIQVGPDPRHIEWRDKDNAEAAVSGLLQDIVIRHKLEECVDMPVNHQYAVPFTLDRKHRAIYQKLAKDAVVKLEDKTITAVNAAVLYTKLLQCASGAVYNDMGSYSLIDSARYELVLDLVEARPHSVVFFLWRHQKEELIREATKRGITYAVLDGTVSDRNRSATVTDYQEGRYRTLFAHPQSAGHGLTLTRGVATIWASPTVNLEHYLQGYRRIYRIGQTERTETIVVVANDTIDVPVWAALQEKDVKMSTLLNLLKEMAAP